MGNSIRYPVEFIIGPRMLRRFYRESIRKEAHLLLKTRRDRLLYLLSGKRNKRVGSLDRRSRRGLFSYCLARSFHFGTPSIMAFPSAHERSVKELVQLPFKPRHNFLGEKLQCLEALVPSKIP